MFSKKGYIVVQGQGRRGSAHGAVLDAGGDDLRDDEDSGKCSRPSKRSSRCSTR
jgi:hypothetical protein